MSSKLVPRNPTSPPKKQWIEVSVTIAGGDYDERNELASTIGMQAKNAAKKRGLTVDISENADEGL